MSSVHSLSNLEGPRAAPAGPGLRGGCLSVDVIGTGGNYWGAIGAGIGSELRVGQLTAFFWHFVIIGEA